MSPPWADFVMYLSANLVTRWRHAPGSDIILGGKILNVSKCKM